MYIRIITRLFALGALLGAGACGGGGASGGTEPGDGDGGGDGTADGFCECKVDWKIRNLATCVFPAALDDPTVIYSSSLDEQGAVHCDALQAFPQPVPKDAWSAQEVASSCAGTARVCVSLRQGRADAPTDDDCIITSQCLDVDYPEADTTLELPPLVAWSAQDGACSTAYEKDGGYVELRIESADFGCGSASEPVLRRVQTCPVGCDRTPDDPKCDVCDRDSTLVTSF